MKKSTKAGDRLTLKNGAIALAILFAIEAIVFFAGDYRRGGFYPCERLDERICTDLGHERCYVWEGDLHRVESGSVTPAPYRSTSIVFDRIREGVLGWNATRSDNVLCYRQLSHGYRGLLETINGEINKYLASHPPPLADPR
jgi:hypothetical protein